MGSDGVRFQLRRATSHDFEFIFRVRESGLREHVARLWEWKPADQRARFHAAFDPDRYQIILIDDQEVGALSVRWHHDSVAIADIEILPEWRGQGIGTALIRSVNADAHAQDLPVMLQVLRGNRARDLYARLGFVEVGETETHIRMRCAPPPEP